MNLLERTIAAVSPQSALKRAGARQRLNIINSGYGNYGASHTKKSLLGWLYHGGSANEDIQDNLPTLRQRSRDLYMGVPLATGAVKTMRTNVVGSGLTLNSQIDNEYLGLTMYNRQFWQDHVTQHENRYREQNNTDGTITHVPVEGEILQEGTPQNARNFNNLETGVFGASEIGAELVRQMLQQKRALSMVKGESGTITLTNSLAYPFNDSAVTVPLAEVRDTTDYTVEIDANAGVVGNVGRFIVTDKLKNGFKIAFTGGAASVTVKYTVRGGVL